MAIAIAFLGFNDLERTMSPVFLLMDHFLYQLSAFSEKNFLQNARSNSVLFSSSFIALHTAGAREIRGGSVAEWLGRRT